MSDKKAGFLSSLITLLKSLVLEILPLNFDFACEGAGEGLDWDIVVAAELPPENEARIELPRPVRNLVSNLPGLLVSHYAHAPSALVLFPLRDSVAEEREEVQKSECGVMS